METLGRHVRQRRRDATTDILRVACRYAEEQTPDTQPTPGDAASGATVRHHGRCRFCPVDHTETQQFGVRSPPRRRVVADVCELLMLPIWVPGSDEDAVRVLVGESVSARVGPGDGWFSVAPRLLCCCTVFGVICYALVYVFRLGLGDVVCVCILLELVRDDDGVGVTRHGFGTRLWTGGASPCTRPRWTWCTVGRCASASSHCVGGVAGGATCCPTGSSGRHPTSVWFYGNLPPGDETKTGQTNPRLLDGHEQPVRGDLCTEGYTRRKEMVPWVIQLQLRAGICEPGTTASVFGMQ